MGWFKKSPEDKIRAERDRQAAKLRRNKAEGAFLKARQEAAIKMKAKEGAEYYSKPHGFAAVLSGFSTLANTITPTKSITQRKITKRRGKISPAQMTIRDLF